MGQYDKFKNAVQSGPVSGVVNTSGLTTGHSFVPAFDELLADTGISNPYTAVNPDDYKMNRKGRLKYNQDLAEAEYLAQMQLMMYQNQYNSASEQAQRMKAAGLNPDLTGVSGEAAATPAGVQRPDTSAIKTNGDLVAQGIGIVDTALSIATAGATGFLNLQGMAEALTGSKLDNLTKMAGFADAFAPILGLSALATSEDGADVLGPNVQQIVDSANLPRRDAKRLGQYLTRFSTSPSGIGRAFDMERDLIRSRTGYAKEASSPIYSEDVNAIMDALKPLSKAEFEIAKLNLTKSQAKLGNDINFERTFDPIGHAEALNSENTATKAENDINAILRKAVLKSVNRLEKEMEKGNKWATATLTGIYAAVSGVLGTPSFGFSTNTNQGVDKFGNPQTTTHRSQSFSF